ncbi:hypothetical protein A2U01_0064403, partial [Trifolium medium]|nr:hypothetical protein [Trifolium medium]
MGVAAGDRRGGAAARVAEIWYGAAEVMNTD